MSPKIYIPRRRFLSLTAQGLTGLSTALFLGSCGEQATTNSATKPSPATVASSSPTASAKSPAIDLSIKTKVFRIGYQSAGDLVKARKVLEKKLEPLGVTIEWAQFAQGPQLMEAMNVGKIDFGAVGESPPIFAQAAGADIVYVIGTKNTPLTAKATIIAVPPESPIQKLEDIKGQEVYFQKGSASHYFIVRALQEIGLTIKDIKVKSAPTVETRGAFIEGKIPVWVSNDPHYAIAEDLGRIRVIKDGVGLDSPGAYYVARKQFALENLGLLKVVIEELQALDLWAEANRGEVTEVLVKELKLKPSVAEKVVARRTYAGRRGLTPQLIKEQQRVADLFFDEKVIPKKIDIKDALLSPEIYAAITPPELLKE
jgi:sulfonate transport system substrate-binding protein